jgi:trehalose 6-phosphate synthase
MRDKIVLVSNRGPLSFVQENGAFETKRGAGGLVGALDPVARGLGDHATWIAAASSDADRAAIAAGEDRRLRHELGYPMRLLDIEPKEYDLYYNVVSNRMLWFANHCLWDELGIEDFGEAELAAWNEAYEPVNRVFAETAADVATDDALILLQDYHLTRAPAILRDDLGIGNAIGHFTHSSFCTMEGLGQLPDPLPTRILEGMLGSDLIGFHVSPWARAFYECCEWLGGKVDRDRGIVNYRGRISWVRTYPITIDQQELRERASGDVAQTWARRFADDAMRLLVRADRAEPSKNIVRGFEAWGRLLDRRPDLRETARFVACLYPSRESMDEYQSYAGKIETTVEEVNARHPGSIDYFLRDDYDRTLGALMSYDALLVNSIMDGMNLVSKEGPAVNEGSGVLILTTGAGSFEELGEHAVGIEDPYDVDATADAMETALDMPMEERAHRAEALRKIIDSHTLNDWIEAQLDDLSEISEGRPPKTPPARMG